MYDRERQKDSVRGLELAEGFFNEEVEPILSSRCPALKYSAALIGRGSEVLGLDSEMSTDHHWGPRVMLFLKPEDLQSLWPGARLALSRELPLTYRGYSTDFSEPDPEDHGTQVLRPLASRPVNHRVEAYSIGGFFAGYLGIDITSDLSAIDWLTLPHQKLRSIVAGRIFRDDLGLDAVRSRFIWYPNDVWLYILASLWTRIGQEEHLMGRAGLVGDEAGSAIIGARLARDVMRLAFLMEKQYPPYPKWFGTAFSQLNCAQTLNPIIARILHSSGWQEREQYLCQAYRILGSMHNSLRITEYVSPEVIQFFRRPFKIIRGERYVKAIIHEISDPEVIPLTTRSLIGSVDLFSDNTDVLEDVSLHDHIRGLYRQGRISHSKHALTQIVTLGSGGIERNSGM